MFRLPLVAACAAAALLVVAGPGTAASAGKCHHSGQKVISVDQLVIYYSPAKGYYGCYTKTGKVTHLASHRDYFASGVVAHGSHATVLDGPPITIQGPADSQFVTMWNLKTGKQYATHEYGGDLELEFIDSPFGDPITGIGYLDGHTRVLDVIYDKGFKRLSTKSVKARSVSVDRGRVVRWTEGSKRRSKKL